MKKYIAVGLALACLFALNGCSGKTPLTAEEAEAMLEAVYPLQFSLIDTGETTTDDGSAAYIYTFEDPVGEVVHFTATVEQNESGGWEAVGRSDYAEQQLIAFADQWNALCEVSGIDYVQEGAYWQLQLAYTEDVEELVMEIALAAELISAMLEEAPIQETQTKGYVHPEFITVYYQTETDSEDSVFISGYNLAEIGIYTLDYLAGDMQLHMRAAGYLTEEMIASATSTTPTATPMTD